jgi:hypothetical protein
MKKVLVVCLIAAALAAGFAVPAFALGGTGNGTQTPPSDQAGWQAMYQACINGDWEGMLGAMDEVHGADFSGMPCFGATGAGSSWAGNVGGGGMMGW